MSDLEALWDQVRAAASARGPQWLQQQLLGMLGGSGADPSSPGSPPSSKRARRVRPPERLSPSHSPRVRRPHGSSVRNPSVSPAVPSASGSSGGPGRNPRHRRDLREEGTLRSLSPSSPPSTVVQDMAAGSPADVPSRRPARRGIRSDAGRGRSPVPSTAEWMDEPVSQEVRYLRSSAAASAGSASSPVAGRKAQRGKSTANSSRRQSAPSAAPPASLQPASQNERVTTARGSGQAQLKGKRPPSTVGGAQGPRSFPVEMEEDDGTPGPAASRGRPPAAHSRRESSAESGEVSSDDGDGQASAMRPTVRSQLGSGVAAARDSGRRQPGESNFLSASYVDQDVGSVAGETGGSQGRVHSGQAGREQGVLGLAEFFAGFRELLDRCAPPGHSGPVAGPTGAWVPAVATSDGSGRDASIMRNSVVPPAVDTVPQRVGHMDAAVGVEVPLSSAVVEAASQTVRVSGLESRKAKESGDDGVRLGDKAQGEVYVCFEGPLGVHLKPEVREKIWRGEYVEIFSLLPLEKFNIDKGKADESKKEEEERRRWRLIPRTFSNWLQAFAILASVIGEKEPENCSSLFCYLDAIGEAYRVYGGLAWLRYDEQFRQRKAVRPQIRWDHKDIGLWMKLMVQARASGQPFPGGAGGSGAGQSASQRKNYCWQFNEGACRFGAACRFRHECSGCGGSHGYAKCFKKGKLQSGESTSKREDAGKLVRDAAVPK